MHSVEVGFVGRRGASILPLCARLELTSLRGTLTSCLWRRSVASRCLCALSVAVSLALLHRCLSLSLSLAASRPLPPAFDPIAHRPSTSPSLVSLSPVKVQSRPTWSSRSAKQPSSPQFCANSPTSTLRVVIPPPVPIFSTSQASRLSPLTSHSPTSPPTSHPIFPLHPPQSSRLSLD